jgi:hypothetical protein
MKFFCQIILLAFVVPTISLAQNNTCINKLDSIKVKRIAKRHNSYWNNNWQCRPSIEFNENSCEWKVTSCKIKITHKGDCKHCNGCTITTSVTLLIDATSAKVKDRIELKHVTRNYE